MPHLRDFQVNNDEFGSFRCHMPISLTYEPIYKMDQVKFKLVSREQVHENFQEYVTGEIAQIIQSDANFLFKATIEFVDMDQLEKSQPIFSEGPKNN